MKTYTRVTNDSKIIGIELTTIEAAKVSISLDHSNDPILKELNNKILNS